MFWEFFVCYIAWEHDGYTLVDLLKDYLIVPHNIEVYDVDEKIDLFIVILLKFMKSSSILNRWSLLQEVFVYFCESQKFRLCYPISYTLNKEKKAKTGRYVPTLRHQVSVTNEDFFDSFKVSGPTKLRLQQCWNENNDLYYCKRRGFFLSDFVRVKSNVSLRPSTFTYTIFEKSDFWPNYPFKTKWTVGTCAG